MTFSIKSALKAIDSRVDPRAAIEREEMQKALAPHIDPETPENRIARAQANEIAVVEQIEMLRNEPNTELKRTRLDTAFNRLGEIYAEQGKYHKAIEVTKDAVRRKAYRDILKAIERPDDQVCKCESRQFFDGKTETTINPTFIADSVISEKHGGVVQVHKCATCGFMNSY